MNTYLLSERAKRWTWEKWKRRGGCNCSDYAEGSVSRFLGADWTAFRLGEIQQASIVAGREIARFGKDHLQLKDWAVIEYENV